MTEKFIYGNEDERIYDRAFRSASFFPHTLKKERRRGFQFLALMEGSIPAGQI